MPASDGGSAGTFVVALGSSAVASLFYWAYRRQGGQVRALEELTVQPINEELAGAVLDAPGAILPYAAIGGMVSSEVTPLLRSHFNEKSGEAVVQKLTIKEHDSQRKQDRRWVDRSKVLTKSTNSRPFSLKGRTGVEVQVQEALSSELSLETTHDSFEPVQKSFSTLIVDALSGESKKGIQTIEKMLLVGTQITGIGSVTYSNGQLFLKPPKSGLHYFLTTKSLDEIIENVRFSTRLYKTMSIAFAIASTICMAYFVYPYAKRWLDNRRFARLQEDIQVGDDHDVGGDACVVCYENPREVVILECGHVCSCRRCVGLMTTCPICRQNIARTVPIYNS